MTTPALTVKSQCFEDDGIAFVAPAGQLDAHTHDLLGKKIDALLQHGYTKIVVDLAGLDYISSAGVGLFLAARYKAKQQKGTIVLTNLTEPVAKVFELLNVKEVLTIAMDMQEALNLLSN